MIKENNYRISCRENLKTYLSEDEIKKATDTILSMLTKDEIVKCWEKALKLEQKDIAEALKKEVTKADKHSEICKQLTDTYIKKNADYGDSFGETYKELGIISAVTRISDKVNRLKSLCTKDAQVKDESVKDTLLDCANYCIMTVMQLEQEGK